MKQWQILGLALTVALVIAVGIALKPQEAQASCATPNPDFSGVWINADKKPQLLRSVIFKFYCPGPVGHPVDGSPTTPPKVGLYVQPYINCERSNCFLGEVKTNSSGNVRTATYRFPKFGSLYLQASEVQWGLRKGELKINWWLFLENGQMKSGTDYFNRLGINPKA